jgi:eukaryotic-like serine/threonine-protein kinase
VMDWGLAKTLAGRDEPGTVVGTPGFMAPEQARGGPVDVRTDVWGLGALLRAIPGGVPPKALLAIVEKATASDPAARYPDVPFLAADVVRYLDGERVLAHREGPAARALRVLKRHRVAVLLILAYLVTRALILLLSR